MPNRQLLSSPMTFAYKYFFPVFWVGCFTAATILIFTRGQEMADGEELYRMRWVFLVVTVLGTAIIYWGCVRLKKVEQRGDRLVVSTFNRQIEVPFAEVERVTGSILMSPELVWLHFRRPTELGRKVVFMPKMRFTMAFSRHPLVAELQERIEN